MTLYFSSSPPSSICQRLLPTSSTGPSSPVLQDFWTPPVGRYAHSQILLCVCLAANRTWRFLQAVINCSRTWVTHNRMGHCHGVPPPWSVTPGSFYFINVDKKTKFPWLQGEGFCLHEKHSQFRILGTRRKFIWFFYSQKMNVGWGYNSVAQMPKFGSWYPCPTKKKRKWIFTKVMAQVNWQVTGS